METTVVWEAVAWPGTEHLTLRTGPDGIDADGLVIALDGRPIRLRYRLHCDRIGQPVSSPSRRQTAERS